MAFAVPTILQAQPDTLWTNSIFNAGYDLKVILTPDGGYALGTTAWDEDSARRDTDFALVKTDSVGNEEWRRYYRGMPDNKHVNDGVRAFDLMPDGGYILAGSGVGASMVVRTDSEGEEIWRQYLRNENRFRPSDCVVTEDGDIVIVGYGHTAKLNDDEGEILWVQEYENATELRSCKLVADGGYIIAGGTPHLGAGSNDMYVLKIDEDGELEWEEAYGTEDSEFCLSIIPVSSGGWCLAGDSRFGPNTPDIHAMIVRIDDEGELIWMRRYEEYQSGDYIRDIAETSDGGFIIVGWWNRLNVYCATRVDYLGEPHWRTFYGDYGGINHIAGECYSVHVMEDNSFFLGGFSRDLGAWLIRTEPDPVDLPFELELVAESHYFDTLQTDSTGLWECELVNTGRRYVWVDSLSFEGDSVFTCPIDLPFRVDPTDTAFVPILFQPLEDTTYTATLHLYFGEEQTLEIELSGHGEIPNRVDDFILHPSEFSLSVSPNPFNSTTNIIFNLPIESHLDLALYDISGRQVMTLFSGVRQAGEWSITLNGGNLSSGVYFVRMNAGNESRTRKVVLMK